MNEKINDKIIDLNDQDSLRRINSSRISMYIKNILDDLVQDSESNISFEKLEGVIREILQDLLDEKYIYHFSLNRNDENLRVEWKVYENQDPPIRFRLEFVNY